MTRRTLSITIALALSLFPAGLMAQDVAAADMSIEEMAEAMIHTAGTIEYAAMEVPGFDAGMKIAVLSGDPSAAGPYVLRLSFPDGYRFPAHYHPNAENLTVLSGTLLLAMGDAADESALEEYNTGSFLYIPPEHPHFGGAKGATQIQLHGTGPFDILLVD